MYDTKKAAKEQKRRNVIRLPLEELTVTCGQYIYIYMKWKETLARNKLMVPNEYRGKVTGQSSLELQDSLKMLWLEV